MIQKSMSRTIELCGRSGEGLDDFRRSLNESVCTQQISANGNRFFATFEDIRLGSINAFRYKSNGMSGARRTFGHTREGRIDDFLLAFPLTGQVNVSQAGCLHTVGPGFCFLVTTAKPYEGIFGTPPDYSFSELVVRIPGPLIRHHVPFIDDCYAKPVAVHRGAGKILENLVQTVVEERNNYSDSQANHFGSVVLSSVIDFMLNASELEELQRKRIEPSRSRIFEDAKSFIEENLSNPKLDLELITSHLHISVSYLSAVFAAYSLSAGAYIREMRLQRCREALQAKSLQHQSVIEIARRWGFNSSSSFTRTYKSQFGIPPTMDRNPTRKTMSSDGREN